MWDVVMTAFNWLIDLRSNGYVASHHYNYWVDFWSETI